MNITLPFVRSDLAQITPYVPHAASHSSAVLEQQQANTATWVDRLDTNESPFDLPADLKQHLAESIQTLVESNRYPDGSYWDLKQAIADYANESAPHGDQALTADHISIGNGSDELIRSILIATCLNGAGSVLVADPTFSMYAILAQTLGIPVRRVGRLPGSFAIDLQSAQMAIQPSQVAPVRVVFVVHPNSPTGNALAPAEVDWLKSLPENILVVVDEAYFEFSQTTLVHELSQRCNWIILRTFSKAFRLAAHRVGYAIAAPALIAVLEKVRLPYNLPAISQIAAHLALNDRVKLLESVPQLLRDRDQLIKTLSQHPVLNVQPSQANFVYVTLQSQPSNASDQLLCIIHQTLQQQGTLIRQIAGGLRITVGTPEENRRTVERLFEILARLE